MISGLCLALLILAMALWGLGLWVALRERPAGDVRMITAAGVILPAFTEISAGLPSLVLITFVILANTAASSWIWLDYAGDYRQLEASFRQLEPGAAVLVGRAEPTPAADLPLLQAPALAAPAANVFVSSLFTVPGEQPIAPRPAFASLDMAQGAERAPPPLSVLVAIAHGAPAQANLARWPERYRYLYVIGRPGADPLPQRLTRLAVGRRFVLYRVLTASGGAGSG